MKVTKKILAVVIAAVMIVTMMPGTVEAKTKTKLNKKSVTLTITNTKKKPTTTLKIKGVSKKTARKAKWTSSKKSVATVKRTTAGNGKITAKKAGTTTITCKVKGKKYKCKVKVVDKHKKNTNSNSLNVTIKDLSEVSVYCPDPYKKVGIEDRIQHAGYIGSDPTGEKMVNSLRPLDDPTAKPGAPVYWISSFGGGPILEQDPDAVSAYTTENINVYKTTRCFLFASARHYIVNSKIVVAYDGKDVTDKATYKIRESSNVSTLPYYSDGTQIKDGILPAGSLCGLSDNNHLKLIVTYKGMKKTIPIDVSHTPKSWYMCYCGALYDDEASCDAHRRANTMGCAYMMCSPTDRHVETCHNCHGYWWSDKTISVYTIKAK